MTLCIFIGIHTDLNPALVGLVLTYVVSLTDLLQYSVRLSTEVENNVSHSVLVGSAYTPQLQNIPSSCVYTDGVC